MKRTREDEKERLEESATPTELAVVRQLPRAALEFLLKRSLDRENGVTAEDLKDELGEWKSNQKVARLDFAEAQGTNWVALQDDDKDYSDSLGVFKGVPHEIMKRVLLTLPQGERIRFVLEISKGLRSFRKKAIFPELIITKSWGLGSEGATKMINLLPGFLLAKSIVLDTREGLFDYRWVKTFLQALPGDHLKRLSIYGKKFTPGNLKLLCSLPLVSSLRELYTNDVKLPPGFWGHFPAIRSLGYSSQMRRWWSVSSTSEPLDLLRELDKASPTGKNFVEVMLVPRLDEVLLSTIGKHAPNLKKIAVHITSPGYPYGSSINFSDEFDLARIVPLPRMTEFVLMTSYHSNALRFMAALAPNLRHLTIQASYQGILDFGQHQELLDHLETLTITKFNVVADTFPSLPNLQRLDLVNSAVDDLEDIKAKCSNAVVIHIIHTPSTPFRRRF